jgi:hypothetical protein
MSRLVACKAMPRGGRFATSAVCPQRRCQRHGCNVALFPKAVGSPLASPHPPTHLLTSWTSKASAPLLQVRPNPSVMVPLSLLLQPTVQSPGWRVLQASPALRHISPPEPRFQLFFCIAATFDVPADLPDVLSLLFLAAGMSWLSYARLHAGLLLSLSGTRLAWLALLSAGSARPLYPCAAIDGGSACTCAAPGAARSGSNFSIGTSCACACPLGSSGSDTAYTSHVFSPGRVSLLAAVLGTL